MLQVRNHSVVGLVDRSDTAGLTCSGPDPDDGRRRLGEGLYLDGRLPARIRTVTILRTCARVGGAYEWGGLDPEQCIEVLVVSGWYRMIAVTRNALDLGIGIEDWMRPWPTGGDGEA